MYVGDAMDKKKYVNIYGSYSVWWYTKPTWAAHGYINYVFLLFFHYDKGQFFVYFVRETYVLYYICVI